MSEDLSWTENPPAIENPDEARQAQEILSRESGVPRGHETAEDLRPAHVENLEPPPKQLSKEQAWFFPALAYCMLGMDRSLFELYAKHLDEEIPVTTYRSEKPISLFDGADITTNPWFYTVQGIPPETAVGFAEFIQTFQFNDPLRKLEWALHIHDTRIADPFLKERTGVSVTLLLPECLTSRRVAVVTRESGLRLDPLHLGLRIREV